MKQLELQRLLNETSNKKFSKLSDAKLASIENLINTPKEFRSKGGKNAINNMNKKNKKNGHIQKLAKLKIGKNRDIDTIKKLKEGSKHSWRPILQFTKDGELIKEWPNFVSIKEKLGFNHTNICACCQNKPKYKSAYGFIWKYKN